MPGPAPRFILLLSLIISCSQPSKSPTPQPAAREADCGTLNSCGPAFRIWSPEAEAILIEKLGGAYAKDNWVPALFLEREEMSEAQLDALEEWSLLAEPGALTCSLADSEVVYKAVIFDKTEGRQIYYGAESACGEAGGDAHYIPLTYFQDFPGDIPYRPQDAGDYVLEKVVTLDHILTVDVKVPSSCASYRSFTLMVDSKLAGGAPPLINGYLRYRTDSDCAAVGRSRLEFDLRSFDFHGAEFLKLKGWTRRQELPARVR